MEARDSTTEPESRGGGEVGGDGRGGKGDEDTDAVQSGLMDQLVEVVESGIGRLRARHCRHGDEQCVDAERVHGIELRGDGFVVHALQEPELLGGGFSGVGWRGLR